MIKEKIRHYSEKKTALCVQNGVISDELFSLYDVKEDCAMKMVEASLQGLPTFRLLSQ